MPNDTNGLQTKFSVPPGWTPNELRFFLRDPKIIQGQVTVATSSAGQETVRQKFSPPLLNGISGPALPPITMEWNKRELEEAIFPRVSKQKIHTGDHFVLHFRFGNTTSDFIENTVKARELHGKRSSYELNSNIKVDGSSIIPRDPGVIISLPPNHYTTLQLDELSRLIKTGLYVKGRISRLDQETVRDLTQREAGMSASSSLPLLNSLNSPNIALPPIINPGNQSERAAFNVPLVVFKPERLLRGKILPIDGIHLVVPESSLRSIERFPDHSNQAMSVNAPGTLGRSNQESALTSAEGNSQVFNFCIKSKDSSREPLGDATKRHIASIGRFSSSWLFIPGIKVETFRSREMTAEQSRSVAPSR